MVTSTTNAAASAGSTLVSQLGGGSGIDNAALINQLVDISQGAQTTRLDTKKTTLQTQISDFGLMRSSIGKLSSTLTTLGSADTFNAKAVSIPDTSLLGVTKLEASAVAGDYQIKVLQVAKAQSLATGVYAAQDSAIGKGSLQLRFGSWNGALDAFAVNAEKTGATITIDDSNNTLSGLRDAINKAGIGVQASIVSDGGGFKLLLTSPSGATNQLEITATEDPSDLGLANFNFNEGSQVIGQAQAGQDAQVSINGLVLTRSNNHITDAIQGLEFDLFKMSADDVVTLNITQDKSLAEQAIRDFVAGYNTFLAETEKLVGFDPDLGENGEYGSLHQDPLAKSLIETVRRNLSVPVTGSTSAFDTLASVGIRTKIDGTLEIIENNTNTDFKAALNNHYDALRDLFVPKTSSNNSKITVKGFSGASVAGNYAVDITTQPAKGYLNGGAISGVSFPLDTTGKDYSFKIKVDGKESNLITLPDGKTYNTEAELAAELQAFINLDTNIKAGKASVSVSYNAGTNGFDIVSANYGASSNIEITTAGANLGDLGLVVGAGVAGVDVAGTVDGVAAFGYGNILLPALGSKAEGLQLIIGDDATTGEITFSRGFANQMASLLNGYTKSSGLIKNHETSINKDIAKVKDDQEALTRRSDAYRARLQAQFSAMESIVRSLNATSASLDNILNIMPFTASSGN